MKNATDQQIRELVEWWANLYAERTRKFNDTSAPFDPYDGTPGYRVSDSEVRAKMKEMGIWDHNNFLDVKERERQLAAMVTIAVERRLDDYVAAAVVADRGTGRCSFGVLKRVLAPKVLKEARRIARERKEKEEKDRLVDW